MSIEFIGLLTLVLGSLALASQPWFIVYAFFCATLLGAAAAFILTSMGGTNISPAHLLLGFLVLKLISNRIIYQNAFQQIAPGTPTFWLLLTVIYAGLSSFFMPRMFAGQTLIVPVRNVDAYIWPLAPVTSNLTQSIYLIADFVCFTALCAYSALPKGRLTLGHAALTCCILNLLFAALDLLTYTTGTTEVLSFIRNANYGLLSDTELAGFKRIVGSFTEASSFGSATLGYFAFTSRLWFLGVKPRLTFYLALLSLVALLFSTSTTSYVGLGGYSALVYLELLVLLVMRRATGSMKFFLVAAPFLAPIIVLGIALNNDLAAYFSGLLDTLIFNKLSTESGIERSAWNTQAIQNLFDTFGFGVGNGSARASSFPIAVLANLGILGSVLYGLFLISLLRANPIVSTPLESAFQKAAKSACIAWLITATVSGALTDLGLAFFSFAAIACAEPMRAYAVQHASVPAHGSPA